jgi:alpha-mannosidase
MRRIIFFYLLIFTFYMFPQSNVDKITSELEILVRTSFNNWKISPDLKELKAFPQPPFTYGFDDSQWDDLTLNQSFYLDSCWIRKEIILPASILGKTLKGRVKLLVSVDDFGYMYINGEYKGKFPWNGEFILTDDAKPGDRFLIAIRAVNTGGPLRLISAQIESDNTAPVKKEIEDLILSLRTGQKLLSFDTYQSNARVKVDPGTDKSTVNREKRSELNQLLQDKVLQLNTSDIKNGNTDKFLSSVDLLKEELLTVRDFVKNYTLYFSSNAHIDAAWLWRSNETVEVAKNTFSSVLRMMDSVPHFTYSQSAAVYYDWMEKLYPEIFVKY